MGENTGKSGNEGDVHAEDVTVDPEVDSDNVDTGSLEVPAAETIGPVFAHLDEDLDTESNPVAEAEEPELDMQTPEEEERETEISRIIEELRFEIPEKNIGVRLGHIILYLIEHYPEVRLTNKEIKEIIGCKLEDMVIQKAADLNLPLRDAALLISVMNFSSVPTPELLAALPELQAFLLLYKEDISDLVDQATAEKQQKEAEPSAEEDGGGEEEDSVPFIVGSSVGKKNSDSKASSGSRGATSGKNKKISDDQKNGIKKALKHGVLTTETDLRFHKNIPEILAGSTFELKLGSLKRIMNEWNFESGQPPELFSIAIYLLCYYFHIAPYFEGGRKHKEAEEEKKDLDQLPLPLFFRKTLRLNVQIDSDPMLKLYYPRLMNQVGNSFIKREFDYDEYFETGDTEQDDKSNPPARISDNRSFDKILEDAE